MTKNEIKKEIIIQEQEIMEKLNSLGCRSSVIKLQNGKEKVVNQTLNTFLSYFNKGFYDNYSKEIKRLFNINPNYSIDEYTSKELLEYKLKALPYVYEIICDNGILETREDFGVVERMKWLGVNLRRQYKDQYQRTPFKDLETFNDSNYLEKVLTDKVEYFSQYNEELLRIKAKEKIEQLKTFLPNYFKDKLAYGNSIGILNKTFYEYESKEVFKNMRESGIKTSNKNLIDLMNKEHLIYRLTALYYIDAYKDKYDQEDFNLFKNKVALIGTFTNNIFNDKNNIKPYTDFIRQVQETKGKKHPKYKLNEQKQQIQIKKDDGEQLELFDIIDKNKQL